MNIFEQIFEQLELTMSNVIDINTREPVAADDAPDGPITIRLVLDLPEPPKQPLAGSIMGGIVCFVLSFVVVSALLGVL